jgi:hypothetical protein
LEETVWNAFSGRLRAAQLMIDMSERAGMRVAAGDRNPDLARRDAHLGSDAQQL